MKSADRETGQKAVPDVEDSIPRGIDKLALDFFYVPLTGMSTWFTILAVPTEAKAANFQGSKRLLQRLLKRPANGHRLSDALHLGSQCWIGLGEFFKSETRNLN